VTKRPVTPLDLDGLSHLAPELAAAIAAIASDIALVVSPDGIIRNVALGRNPVGDDTADWVGRAWVDTVTTDTRKKIEQLLSEASTTGVSQRREVSHPSESGVTIPMTYAAIRLGEHGPVLVAGRDLRAIAAIQQRFLDSQQEMERSYWSRRQAESRYRLLFQAATDAVLVVDAESLKVVDANPAASRLLQTDRADLVGSSPVAGIEAKSRRAVEEMLVTSRATGNPSEIRVRLAGDLSTVAVSATPFRGDKEMLLLVRLSSLTDHRRSTDTDFHISGLVENMQEPVVITDSGGRLLMANPAFLQMCQLSREDQIKGMSLGEWLGNAEHDMAALLAEIRHRGIASSITAFICTRVGKPLEVELSAALLTDGEQEHIGITIRHRPRDENPITSRAVTRKLTELTELIGHASMADLLLSLTHMAERHFAQVALERTQGDEDAAAALLGIARDDLARRLEISPASDPSISKPSRLH
jgi:transcriptional regulator PpsR